MFPVNRQYIYMYLQIYHLHDCFWKSGRIIHKETASDPHSNFEKVWDFYE